MTSILNVSETQVLSDCDGVGLGGYQLSALFPPCAKLCPAQPSDDAFLGISFVTPHHITDVRVFSEQAQMANVTVNVQYKMSFTDWKDFLENTTDTEVTEYKYRNPQS